MVFEDLISPISAERHPIKLLFYGVLFSFISVLFSLWIFKDQASLIMVFLVVVMVMPLMYFTLRDQEEWDWKGYSERKLFSQHNKAIRFLLFLFIGFVVGYALFFLFLPDIMVQDLFSIQLDTIARINNVSGNSVSMDAFSVIMSNNMKVLFFCLVFALFFGAGAIFILAWNASVISAAVGTFFRNAIISNSANLLGLEKIASYFHIFVIGIFRYLTHGIFEITAYFFGALAGGIISMSIIRHGISNKNFKKVLIDASLLTFVALVLLFIGAIVEVYVTPLIF